MRAHASRGVGLAALVAALLPGSRGAAHGLDAGRVTVVLRGARVEVVATPPVAAVSFADTDRDGLLSTSEIDAARPALRERLRAGLRVTGGVGDEPAIALFDVATPADHGHAGGVHHLRVTLQADFKVPPASLRLEVDFAAEAPLEVLAWRATPSPDAGVVQLGGPPERARLDGTRTEVLLFAPRATTPRAVEPPPPRAHEGCGGGDARSLTLLATPFALRSRRRLSRR